MASPPRPPHRRHGRPTRTRPGRWGPRLSTQPPKGSRLVRELLAELATDLVVVYTPPYDPDANRIEWLWRALRRSVTDAHQRESLAELLADAQRWAGTITPAEVLSQIGSPFAADPRPVVSEELDHAA